MPDRNYPMGSEGIIDETNQEFPGIKEIKKNPDIELIRVYLNNLEAAFKQYRTSIESVLNRLEAFK